MRKRQRKKNFRKCQTEAQERMNEIMAEIIENQRLMGVSPFIVTGHLDHSKLSNEIGEISIEGTGVGR